MLDPDVASGYSWALFRLAQKQNRTEEVNRELGEFARAVESLAELRALWVKVRLPVDRKTAVLRGVLAASLSPLMMRFLEVLVKRRREKYLWLIVDQFTVLVRRAAGREEVEVVSAVPLPEPLRAEIMRLAAVITEREGLEPEVLFRVEPEVVGGVRIRAGDCLIDGTVRGRLKRLERHLAGGVPGLGR
ncbi:MAG: ATP synthase F1 subunit delta [Clostridia bacterium]|nr:ATP synthase F1 subunit delta [Clostridia bacterium]MDQ7790742.1 ATP synthase F1 subunit delta [Clostridia bacterium]